MRLAIAAFFSTAAVWAAACGKTPCASTNVETADGWCVLPITCPEGTQPSLHHERCELPDGGVAVARESVDAGAQRTTTSGIERAAGSGGNRSPEAGSSGTAGQVGTDWDDADAGMSSVDTSPEMIDAGSERPRCGNGLVEPGEECDGNCPSACPPTQGCLASELQGNAAVCTAKCVPLEITAPTPGDDCCPMGADYATDTDCSPSCGDGVLTAPEKCEPGSTEHPCPSRPDCDDRIDCTEDSVTGSAEQCSATCAHTPIMRARAGDGCCPAGANIGSDSDCEAACGDGVVSSGESCDTMLAGSCPSARTCERMGDGGCMRGRLTGSGCNAQCEMQTITERRDDDQCCPAGANAGNDNDCPVACGDGVVSSGEDCDTMLAGSCPSASTCEAMGSGGCMRGRLTGSGCNAQCEMQTITERRSDDQCCPSGANIGNDNDCPAVCGDGIVSRGEMCDGDANCAEFAKIICDDNSDCTVDTLSGPDPCNPTCMHTPSPDPNCDLDPWD